MLLNESKLLQVTSWLDSKGVTRDCKVCEVGKMQFIGIMLSVFPAEYSDSSITTTNAVLDRHLPVIGAKCENCAHLLFFDYTSIEVGITSNK